MDTSKPHLMGYDLPALEALIETMGEPGFRARQLHAWLYVHAKRDFSEMTNLSKAFREKLHAQFQVGVLEIAEKQVSQDGTIKYLFRLPDGNQVESVLMHYDERGTYSVCMSTQVGCAVNCDFCATGKLGFKRHLTVAEIVDQFLYVRADSGIRPRNIVFMGQGEPLLNYDNTLTAIRVLNQSAEVGMRNMTLSTSGIVPTIDRLAEEKLPLTLAVSLHAPDNETRQRMMPINKKYPIETLIPALERYYQQTKRRMTIEYILIKDFNDSLAHAKALRELLKDLKCYVNLIPYNSIGAEYGYEKPSKETIYAFRDELYKGFHTVTVRLERGADIDAACGQLSNQYQAQAALASV